MSCLVVLEAASLRSRCWQGWFLLRLRAGLPQASVSLLPVVCWWFLAFLVWEKHHLIPAFMFTWLSPCVHVCVHISCFLKDASHSGLRSHPNHLIWTSDICSEPISNLLRLGGSGGYDFTMRIWEGYSSTYSSVINWFYIEIVLLSTMYNSH